MSDEIEDDEDDNEDVDDDNDIEALVNKLPLEMRRKILSKDTPISDEEDSEGEDEEDENEKNRWGKKKNYWNADTADVEDADDLDDAKEEEAATKELFQSKLKRMQQTDFYDDLEENDGSDSDADDLDDDSQNKNTMGAKLTQSKKQQQKLLKQNKKNKDFLVRRTTLFNNKNYYYLLIFILLSLFYFFIFNFQSGSDDADILNNKQREKDISKLSKAEKLELLKSHSPELIAIVEELKERISELQTRISPLREYLRKMKDEEHVEGIQDDLVDYLDVKQQLLFAYITNVTFYLYMKSVGKSVRSHPVMGQLLRLRYAMEKLQTID